jgi:bifunctional ADP-heptose synthase (sugar kinase/adenylyltransferase)
MRTSGSAARRRQRDNAPTGAPPDRHRPRRTPGRALGRELVSEADVLAAGRDLLALLAPSAVLVTGGAAGMILFEPAAVACHVPAREVFDVTGAGDSVTAVLAVALAAGANPIQAARLAASAAAVVVGQVGTTAIRLSDLVKP